MRLNEMNNRIVDNTLKINEIQAKIRVMDGRIDGFEAKVKLIESLKSDNGNNNFSGIYLFKTFSFINLNLIFIIFIEFINEMDNLQKSMQKYLTSDDLKDIKQTIMDVQNEQKISSKYVENLSKNHTEFQQITNIKLDNNSEVMGSNIERITLIEEKIKDFMEFINKPLEGPKVIRLYF
jgi:hypothetical protein